MILLERRPGRSARRVVEGRRTFSNVMKYIMMATSSNFAEHAQHGGGVGAAAVPADAAEADLAEQPAVRRLRGRDSVRQGRRRGDRAPARLGIPASSGPLHARLLGRFSSLFDFATFAMLRFGFNADATLFRTGWSIESMATQVLVVFVLSTRGRPWKSRPHPLAGRGSRRDRRRWPPSCRSRRWPPCWDSSLPPAALLAAIAGVAAPLPGLRGCQAAPSWAAACRVAEADTSRRPCGHPEIHSSRRRSRP